MIAQVPNTPAQPCLRDERPRALLGSRPLGLSFPEPGLVFDGRLRSITLPILLFPGADLEFVQMPPEGIANQRRPILLRAARSLIHSGQELFFEKDLYGLHA